VTVSREIAGRNQPPAIRQGAKWRRIRETGVDLERFDIFAPANDSGRNRQDSWTLLVNRTDASVHIEHNWGDDRSGAQRQGMRIVTLAEFLRRELDEGLKSRAIDTLHIVRIAANDP
jgi:hypothetical protein